LPLVEAVPVLAGELLDVGHRADVGELARLLLLQRLEELRQRAFVLLPCLFHPQAFGLEGLGLLGGRLLASGEIAVARPLAFRDSLLRRAREGVEQLLVFLRPGPRRLDGGRLALAPLPIGTLSPAGSLGRRRGLARCRFRSGRFLARRRRRVARALLACGFICGRFLA